VKSHGMLSWTQVALKTKRLRAADIYKQHNAEVSTEVVQYNAVETTWCLLWEPCLASVGVSATHNSSFVCDYYISAFTYPLMEW